MALAPVSLEGLTSRIPLRKNSLSSVVTRVNDSALSFFEVHHHFEPICRFFLFLFCFFPFFGPILVFATSSGENLG